MGSSKNAFTTKKKENMKNLITTLLVVVASQVLSAGVHVLPTPTKLIVNNGTFTLTEKTTISSQESGVTDYLRARLTQSTQYPFNNGADGKSSISLVKQTDEKPIGSYTLDITPQKIAITAGTDQGLFYGVQTLLQLLPAEIYSSEKIEYNWAVPCVSISDTPKYQWRSFMLDSGRQYQTIEFIKKYIDLMAMMKMNVFHWHLTEADGWRVEIKKYPKLTSVGAFVADGAEQKGFYTQQEVKETVAYAAERHIDVVPEIDVPGHSLAALKAYPEMTCMRKISENAKNGISKDLFCGGRVQTTDFLKDVLDEVCELFPSKYIHIGGDEAPKDVWDKCSDCQERIKKEGLKNSHELQLDMTNRLARHLKTKGRKAICWGDVVTHPGQDLEENIVIHWWNWRRNKDKALKEAIKRNREVICNTNYYTYLNFPLDPWKGYKADRIFNLKMTYESNPSDLKTPAKNVLGMGSAMWTDFNVTMDLIDQRVFPRVFALAEQMWTTAERKPYEEFLKSVRTQYPRLKVLGVEYGKEVGTTKPKVKKRRKK